MRSLESIKSELADAKSLLSGSPKKEVKRLPKILKNDERITDAIEGFLDPDQGLLVATDQRLIFVSCGLLYGVVVKRFPLHKINSIEHETDLQLGSLVIKTSSSEIRVKSSDKKAIRNFSEGIELS